MSYCSIVPCTADIRVRAIKVNDIHNMWYFHNLHNFQLHGTCCVTTSIWLPSITLHVVNVIDLAPVQQLHVQSTTGHSPFLFVIIHSWYYMKVPCGDYGILRVRIITKLKIIGSLHVAFRLVS